MPTTPVIEQLPPQDYAYIRFTVPMNQMQKPATEGFPALMAWLAERGVTPTAAPFYNYRRIDMANTLDVEAGVTVDRIVSGDQQVHFGTLPAGHYATTRHTGHYDGLMAATGHLIDWARDSNIAWDMRRADDGDHFACRLEIYETDPDEEPNPENWVTTLRFKIAGPA